MSYGLGIDLGTTYTAAAVARSGDAEVVTLGTRSTAVASVIYLGPDGTVLFGEAAERRAVTDPGRVVREFKRRIGDETPVLIDGRPYPAHELAASMVRWVVDRVTQQEGGPARRIAVTRPASWGAHKKELFRDALAAEGLRVTRLAEPQAAAVAYAAAERVEPGSTIAVYDLGGGTFDATVVRKSHSGGFELLGQPEGIEDLGGVDFDEAVFRHVAEGLDGALDDLDPADPDVLTAVARLRRECVEAKEALSADTEVTIPVLLPGVQTSARLTRAEFEEMIRPDLERTVETLGRAVASAGLTPQELTAVLLVGGSSRIPLVTRLVSAEFGLPVAVDADPRTAIAAGAALVVSGWAEAEAAQPALSRTALPPVAPVPPVTSEPTPETDPAARPTRRLPSAPAASAASSELPPTRPLRSAPAAASTDRYGRGSGRGSARGNDRGADTYGRGYGSRESGYGSRERTEDFDTPYASDRGRRERSEPKRSVAGWLLTAAGALLVVAVFAFLLQLDIIPAGGTTDSTNPPVNQPAPPTSSGGVVGGGGDEPDQGGGDGGGGPEGGEQPAPPSDTGTGATSTSEPTTTTTPPTTPPTDPTTPPTDTSVGGGDGTGDGTGEGAEGEGDPGAGEAEPGAEEGVDPDAADPGAVEEGAVESGEELINPAGEPDAAAQGVL